MMYPDSFIDEVRNAASVVEVIGGYVTLKKRGRNHVGLCPFHSEKTPSFNVSHDRQWYHCFGCGAGGDVFKFLSQVEHLSFPETVRWLAEKYGIPLPAQSDGNTESRKDREAILAANQAAETFFVHHLHQETEGREALRYLLHRGLQEQAIRQFALGYAPGGGGLLLTHLKGRGFSPELLEKANLVKKSEMGSGYYDTFRRRIIFPIKDLRGTTIAFGGRVLDQTLPKYLNSSDTLVYTKSRNLFGLHLAKEFIRKQDHVVLVEGYLDCVAPVQAGLRNVVASLGTSLTHEQAKILSRYTKHIVVNYDPDPAGRKATRRSLDLLLEEGFRVNVLMLPEGQDPDSFIRGSGVDKYRELLRRSVPYLEFVADEAVGELKAGAGGRGLIEAVNSVLPFLSKVPDRIERLEYVSKIAHRLQIEDDVILAELKKAAVTRSQVLDERQMVHTAEFSPAERDLIQILLSGPTPDVRVIEEIERQDLEGLRAGHLLKCICRAWTEEGEVSFSTLEKKLSGHEDMRLLSHIYFEENMSSIQPKDAINSLNAIRRMQLTRRFKRLQLEINQARADKDEQRVESLHQEKLEIGRLISTL